MRHAAPTKLVCSLVIVLIWATCTFAEEQKGERESVVSSFQQYIRNFMGSYKTDKREHVVQSPGGWRNGIHEPEPDYSIDLRYTDSLISPYIGTCEFVLVSHYTAFHKTKEDAQNDDRFVNETREKHSNTYAFQDGRWVPKSCEHYVAILGKWFEDKEDFGEGSGKNYSAGCAK